MVEQVGEVLAAVVDEAGFSPAADRLGRSQSAVSYSIQQLEAQLPVALLDHRGRRAQLTDAGATLLRRARSVVEELRTLEALAASLARRAGNRRSACAVDLVARSGPALRGTLAGFGPLCPRYPPLELVESVLSGRPPRRCSGATSSSPSSGPCQRASWARG